MDDSVTKLYLDDFRQAPPGWVTVRNYYDFVAWLKIVGMPDFISFDHDLAFEHYPLAETYPGMKIPYDSYKEPTGYHAAKYIVENELPMPRLGWQVHSQNPVGRQNIEGLLLSYERHLKRDRESIAV